MLKFLLQKIKLKNKANFNFVLINTFTTLLRFGRSIVFMKFLNFTDLGLVTIVSTIMALFGIFQLGLLNGGYRIFSLKKSEEDEVTVNSVIYTYFLILFVLLLVLASVLKVFCIDFGLNFGLVVVALMFGVVTLISNWINNQLSAHMSFKSLNYLELISTLISLPFILLIPKVGLWGALSVIFSTPLIYVFGAYIKHPYLLPTKLQFNIKAYRWILSYGFIPFLTGIFVQLHSQIERWGIVNSLNVEALGRFSLPLFYSTFFMMVPLSVNKLFFPPAIHNFTMGKFAEVKRILKNYLVFNLIYALFAFVVTYFLLKPIVSAFLPNHLTAIHWIWYLYPGLIALLFLQPLEIIYSASVRLFPVFWAYFASVFFMAALVLAGSWMFSFSLTMMAIIKSLVLIFIFSFLLINYANNKRTIWKINSKNEDWRHD